jgi:hypothetical protein
MPAESSVLGLKRSSLDDEPSAVLKRARAIAEEPDEDLPTADSFIDRLVFGIRSCQNSGDARSFAESQLRPVLAKTQRQTEATRILFKALQNLQNKMARQQEFMASETEKLKKAEERASAAERQVQTLIWQIRTSSNSVRHPGNHFPGPDPGVF